MLGLGVGFETSDLYTIDYTREASLYSIFK